jgi:hypothetical protein
MIYINKTTKTTLSKGTIMKKNLTTFVLVFLQLLILVVSTSFSDSKPVTTQSVTIPVKSDSVLTPITKIKTFTKNKTSKVTVTVKGTIIKILSDDNEGARHQRFIIKLSNAQTLMISHNIDIAPRVTGIAVNKAIIIHGEYIWNEQGGLIHWTHHDPDGTHTNGWIIFNGKKYQ